MESLADIKNLTKLGPITTPYGGQTTQEKVHPGVDIANKKGTPIPAFAGGRVLQVVNGKQKGTNDFGNFVVVEDNEGNKHRYSHLDKVNVSPGENVLPSQKIATMGDSGATYAEGGGDSSNLDYRVVDAYSRYIDPSVFFRGKI